MQGHKGLGTALTEKAKEEVSVFSGGILRVRSVTGS